jgi:ubiquinone/menaquinone biosynthesis C-methylase UbiE
MAQLEVRARQLWSHFPEPLVNSPVLVHSIRRAAGALRRGDETFRVLRTLGEVDEMLAEIDAAAATSDDELRRCFRSFRMEVDWDLPDDPFSDAYRTSVMDCYQWLRGESYTNRNEHVPFDVLAALDNPFPYATKSVATVGEHLMAIGRTLRVLDLPPGSRVLEFGAGWGNLTLAMAQAGLQVTAVDIGQNFVDLISARAARLNVDVEVLAGDFSLVQELKATYEVVLFFESFHHCADHQRLVEDLGRVVAPGGRIIFAAEPVLKTFPVPWGLRLDGESVWAIRRNGWLELGFRSSYFRRLLLHAGWRVRSVRAAQTIGGGTFVAERV